MEKVEQQLVPPQVLEWNEWAGTDQGKSCLTPSNCPAASTRAAKLAFLAGVKAQANIFRNAMWHPPPN